MYEHLVAYVNSQFWAMERTKFDAMVSILARRSGGERLSLEEVRAGVEAAGGRAEGPMMQAYVIEGDADIPLAAGAMMPAGRQAVAVIGVKGILSHRAGSMGDSSGGTSTERLAAAVRQAANDAAVAGIVLDIDSPGGSVEGVTELAKEIRIARAQKPVEAVANAHAQSGGAWVGGSAEYFTAIPSALVGALGVYSTHIDTSKADEMAGIKVSVITDTVLSKFKGEGLVGPLTDEARAHRESIADSYAEMFGRDFAEGRGVSQAVVRKNFGQGRSMPAKAALAAGMIDGIGSLEDAIRRAGRGGTAKAKAQALAVVRASFDAAAFTGERMEASSKLRLL